MYFYCENGWVTVCVCVYNVFVKMYMKFGGVSEKLCIEKVHDILLGKLYIQCYESMDFFYTEFCVHSVKIYN